MQFALLSLIALVVLASFWPVTRNEFLNWDDNLYFVQNPHYKGLSAANLRWMFTTTYMSHYQPLSWLSHAIVYSIWGVSATAYHAVTLAIHAINAVLLFLLILQLLARLFPDDQITARSQLAATIGALFYAIHPLRVEAVAWGTERQEVCAGFFFLCSVYTYLRAVRSRARELASKGWYALSIIAFACSLLSKAAGIMLPGVLLILDLYPLRRLPPPPARWQGAARLILEKLPYFALALVAAAIAYTVKDPKIYATLDDHGLLSRAIQSAYGLCFYLWKTVLPLDLSPLYMLHLPLNVSEPRFVLSVLVVVAITVSCWFARRRHPWALAAWASYVLLVSPLLGLFQSGYQLVADRYTYFAVLPLSVLVAGGVHQLTSVETTPFRSRLVIACAVILILLAGLSHRQTQVWADSITLWSHVIDVEPDNSIAHLNRGHAQRARGNLDAALADYRRAADLDPKYAMAYYNLGNALEAKGDLIGALAAYTRAIEIDPQYEQAYSNRGSVRKVKRDFDGAIADFDQAIRLRPAWADAYYNRANTRKAKGDFDGALKDYTSALALDPDHASAYNNRGNLRKAQGDLSGAVDDYTSAVRANPRHVGAYAARAAARLALGDLQGSVADYEQAARLSPNGSVRQNAFRARAAETRAHLPNRK